MIDLAVRFLVLGPGTDKGMPEDSFSDCQIDIAHFANIAILSEIPREVNLPLPNSPQKIDMEVDAGGN